LSLEFYQNQGYIVKLLTAYFSPVAKSGRRQPVSGDQNGQIVIGLKQRSNKHIYE
jgi:hypothetical protein